MNDMDNVDIIASIWTTANLYLCGVRSAELNVALFKLYHNQINYQFITDNNNGTISSFEIDFIIGIHWWISIAVLKRIAMRKPANLCFNLFANEPKLCWKLEYEFMNASMVTLNSKSGSCVFVVCALFWP